jgi:HD-GYP domain-containing protein (c-di-GMP phosphodiesterase class II)
VSDFLGRNLLRLLFHSVQQHRRSAGSQPTPADLSALAGAAEALTQRNGEAVFTVDGGNLYLGREMLPHGALEFRGLVRAMEERSIDSVTLLPGAGPQELDRLAALLAGDHPGPRRGGVRINERPLRPSDLLAAPVAEMRTVYADALDTLQRVSGGLALDLGRASAVVGAFVSAPDPEQRASLLLASTQNCDDIVVYHSVNVCLLSLALGRHLGIGGDRLRLLGMAALVHDVGRIARADGIAEKRERLSGDDWSAIRMHPQEGAAIILAASERGEEVLASVALEHHRRVDGGGYPEMSTGRPHVFSRIVAVADFYDAVTGDRPHRPGRAPHQAVRMLLDGAGAAHDADLVGAFVHMMGRYPPGSLLRLAGGELVAVVPGRPGELWAIVTQDAAGDDVVDSAPFPVEAERIAGAVLPTDAGVVPAGLVEQALGLVAVS